MKSGRQTTTLARLALRFMQGNHPKFLTKAELQTARALGLTVPPGLLVAADEVIE